MIEMHHLRVHSCVREKLSFKKFLLQLTYNGGFDKENEYEQLLLEYDARISFKKYRILKFSGPYFGL